MTITSFPPSSSSAQRTANDIIDDYHRGAINLSDARAEITRRCLDPEERQSFLALIQEAPQDDTLELNSGMGLAIDGDPMLVDFNFNEGLPLDGFISALASQKRIAPD